MAEEFKKLNGRDAKILMGNTEAARGRYYANEFKYDIVDIGSPHNPEKYVEFIEFAENEGYDILILDSSSHEWEGKGGCLELQQQAGGTYQAWGKVTPRHDKFINALADSKMHVIATMRGKDQYEMEKDGNKTTVKKLGVGAKQRDGFEYEFTCTFLIDQKTNMAETQKDNTHLFEHEGAVLLSESHGIKLMQWANSGEGFTPTVRNDKSSIPDTNESKDNLVEDIKKIISQIDVLAKEKAAIDKTKTFDKIKEFARDKSNNPTANYNTIKDITVAKALLESLNNLEVQ